MRIAIIGSGNTASVIGRLLKAAGHLITGIYGKTVEHAQQLAVELNAQKHGYIGDIDQDADLFIIAVKDDAISKLATQLQLPGKVVVHTSGPVPAGVLKNTTEHYGVLYPLQSLRKETRYNPIVPFLIDGSTVFARKTLEDLAKSISPIVNFADDEKRLKLHVAAVVVSNFTNYLYTLAEDFCVHEHLNFHMFTPLIREVAQRATAYSPAGMQTGPAIRKDYQTINKHLEMLKGYPLQHDIYKTISDSITTFYEEKQE
ncbi:MAG TPA: Rossmann-like and DUF2520 domain-containing protein [Chitinophagaceae bacterium]|nr:Rossmann-like and DUF2520 domain-containing protein [Chitinophagaceae bacterium]